MTDSHPRDDGVTDLVAAHGEGRLSRREVLKRGAAFGVGASSLASALAGGSTTAFAAAAHAAAGKTPRRGGTLIEGYDRTFSPITTINAAWIDPTQDALLESLVTTDPNGKIVPKLASSYKLSPDAKTLTFTLRKGLKFQSGAKVTPEVVAQNWNTIRGKTGQDPFWYVQVQSIASGPGNTVVIKCNKPFASGPYLYRQQFANVYNPKTVAANPTTYGTKVVDGTGPFKLTSFSADTAVTAARWDGYAGAGVSWFQNKGKAYLDGIKWVPIADQPSRTNEILSGSVHIIKNPLPTDLPTLKSNPNLVVIEKEEAGALVFALSFRRADLGFTDVRVRQAISMAINRDQIVQAILFGHGTAVRGPFPTTYKWYEPKVEKFNNYNPAKAAALFDAAGWKLGSDGVRAKNGTKLAFNILNRSDTTLNEVGAAVVAMLAKVGVQATMQNMETGAYFQGLGSKPDAYFFDWLWLDFPRIYQVLASKPFFTSSNWAQATVPACEQAFNAWSYAANDSQLEAAARRIQVTVAQNVPVMTLYVPHVVWVHSKKLHGYLPTNPNNLYPFYNDMWLEA
jgi:peptide/nickel transport system substrate-binding protein